MRPLYLLLLLFTLTISAGVSARADDDAWPITQRCFGDATPPPQGWTFDGTLLMTGRYGLHGYHQGWETPHVLVFSSSDIPYSGVLSPDGRWYATIEGTREEVQVVTSWQTKAIHVYSTVNSEKYTIPWEHSFSAVHTLHGHGLYWLDNERLLYSIEDAEEKWFSINPFSGEIAAWQSPFTPSWDQFNLSPDGQKALYREQWDITGQFHNGKIEIPLPVWLTDWRPDSNEFAAYTINEQKYRPNQLVLFDMTGNVVDTLITVPEDVDVTYGYGKGWSPDGHFLLVGVNQRLYIADMSQRELIDICVSITNAVSNTWSPTSDQFVLIDRFHDDRRIQIFDLQTWERYVVGYHSGEVIGWRADDLSAQRQFRDNGVMIARIDWRGVVTNDDR